MAIRPVNPEDIGGITPFEPEIIIGGTSTSPFNALYYFDALDTEDAITDHISWQFELLTERASNSNVEQTSDGSIITYAQGVAGLDVGFGDLIQGDATNLITFSQDFTDASWQTSVTRIEVVTSTEVAPDELTTFDVMQTLADAGINFVRQSFTIAADGVFSVFVKKKNYQYVSIGFLGSQNIFDFDQGIFTVNTENATAVQVGDGWRLSANINFANQLRFATIGIPQDATTLSWASAPPAGLGVFIWQGDFLDGPDFTSSPIYTSGSSATRIADNSTITTLLEKGLLLDKGGNGGVVCVLSDYNPGGAWLNGVNTTSMELFFATTAIPPASVNGKYFDIFNVLWIGSILTTENTILKVSGVGGSFQLEYEIIKGSNSQIQAEYENDGTSSNPFNVDFSTSAYFTDQAQLAIDRAAAGDTLLASLPAVQGWPTTDFRLTVEFEFRGTDSTFPRIFDDNDATSLFYGTSNERVDFGAAGQAVQLVVPGWVFGQNISIEVVVNSTTGTFIIVDGIQSATTAALTSVSWSSTVQICNRNQSDREMNSVFSKAIMEQIT